MTKVKFAVVRWMDAAYSEYYPAEPGLIGCVSCGLLVEEDVDQLTIALMEFSDAAVSSARQRHILSIPKCQIRRRKDFSVSWRLDE